MDQEISKSEGYQIRKLVNQKVNRSGKLENQKINRSGNQYTRGLIDQENQ